MVPIIKGAALDSANSNSGKDPSKDPSKDPFRGAQLFISARSPFARRVRLALHEHDIPFQEEVVDLFAADLPRAHPTLFEANPLARVPAIRLASGQHLVDSSEILSVFYQTRESAWLPKDPAIRLHQSYWSGIALGLFDLIVDYFLEMNRPEPKRDAELLSDTDSHVMRTLGVLEKDLARRKPDQALTQADLDLGTALSYLALRYPRDWEAKYPLCVAYRASLEKRPSFIRTAPPPPQTL